MTVPAPPPTVPGLTGLTVLARGGYATVYRAVQESVGRDVAVKVENRTLESDRDRRRFLREARAAGRMSSHPHVVDLFDAGVTADGHPFLIMELCDGSYSERMKTAPLSAAEACDVGYKIADALADAHSLGVLHRDVKPANILFSRFGEPALADFGLAILAEWRDVSITLDVLTPAYAPPEMFRHGPPSPAADVYALCATLYALMRGKPPRWQADRTPSLVSLVDMFAEEIPDVPGVPPEVMRLLRAGMANDLSARPSAIQLRDALQSLASSVASPPVLIPPLGSPPLPPGAVSPAPAGASGAAPDSEDDTVPHGPQPSVPSIDAAEPPATPRPAVPSQPGPFSEGASPGPGPLIGPHPLVSAQSDQRSLGRKGLWWSLGIAAFIAATFVTLTVVYSSGTPEADPSRTPVAGGSATTATSTATATPGPSRTPPSPTGQATTPPPNPDGRACGIPAPPEARCLAVSECFDTAKRAVNCGTRHTWEAFAFAELPADANAADPATHPSVRAVCSLLTLSAVDVSAATWQIDVLAPTAEELRAGERTYRCLAGKGPNGLTAGPQLRLR